MKILTGHLTATEKNIVKTMLAQGLTEGSVRKVNYHLSEESGVHTCTIKKMDKGLIPIPGSALRLSTYKSTFTL